MYRTLLAPLAALTLAGTALAQDAPPELPRLSAALKDLRGGNGAENAAMMRATFAGEGPAAHRDAVALSAGAMFYLYGISASIAGGVAHASALLTDGTVQRWLATHEEADYSA